MVHQIGNAKTKLRPVTLHVQATDTTGNGSRHTCENIRLHHNLSETQDDVVRCRSEDIGTDAVNHQPAMQPVSHASENIHFPLPDATNVL